MTVFFIVLAVTIVVAIAGILIDRSARDERNEGR